MMMGSKVFLIPAAISTVRLYDFALYIHYLESIAIQHRKNLPVTSSSLLALSSYESSYAHVDFDSGFIVSSWSSSTTTSLPCTTTRLSRTVQCDLDDREAHLTGRRAICSGRSVEDE